MWEEAFKQNQDELNAMEIEIDGLAGGLKAIINPLRKSLPGMEEAAQRLFSLAGTHKLDPIMLESIDQRGVLQASGLRQQMQPVLTAQNVVKDKIGCFHRLPHQQCSCNYTQTNAFVFHIFLSLIVYKSFI